MNVHYVKLFGDDASFFERFSKKWNVHDSVEVTLTGSDGRKRFISFSITDSAIHYDEDEVREMVNDKIDHDVLENHKRETEVNDG